MEGEREKHRESLEGQEDESTHEQRKACCEAERERHRQAVSSIAEAFRFCVGGCHHQGGGRGILRWADAPRRTALRS